MSHEFEEMFIRICNLRVDVRPMILDQIPLSQIRKNILRFLASWRTTADVAACFGIHPTTALKHLSAIQARGLAIRAQRGRYVTWLAR